VNRLALFAILISFWGSVAMADTGYLRDFENKAAKTPLNRQAIAALFGADTETKGDMIVVLLPQSSPFTSAQVTESLESDPMPIRIDLNTREEPGTIGAIFENPEDFDVGIIAPGGRYRAAALRKEINGTYFNYSIQIPVLDETVRKDTAVSHLTLFITRDTE